MQPVVPFTGSTLLNEDALEIVFRYARPMHQWEVLLWVCSFGRRMHSRMKNLLYEEVYISSPTALALFRESIERVDRHGAPALHVKSMFFDITEEEGRDDCVTNLNAVLPMLRNLRILRAAFCSLDHSPLGFWAIMGDKVAPSLRVLRLGDNTQVNASPSCFSLPVFKLAETETPFPPYQPRPNAWFLG